MLTIKQFIKKLSKLPQDAIVVMSKDAEGNGFSPLSEGSTEFYLPNSTYSGDLVETKEKGAKQAVVLWPIN